MRMVVFPVAKAAALLGACLTLAVPVMAETACPGIDGPKCRLTLPSGIGMAYLETGPADGPAVILVHGLTDSSRS